MVQSIIQSYTLSLRKNTDYEDKTEKSHQSDHTDEEFVEAGSLRGKTKPIFGVIENNEMLLKDWLT